ncbi:hypothetical protein FQV17_0012049, partial [Megadyptes antipodes antipodes]
AFFYLRNNWDNKWLYLRKKCGLMDSNQVGIYSVQKDKKMKNEKSCCVRADDTEENVQLLVALPEKPEDSDSDDEGNSKGSPIATRTRGKRKSSKPVLQAPLRQAVGPTGELVYVHVPFTASDLLNWKKSVASHRSNPNRMYSMIKTVMMTRNPNWGHIQAFLEYLFTYEEKRAVLEKAREGLNGKIEGLHQKMGGRVSSLDDLLPKEDPGWDPNRSAGLEKVKIYQVLILYGIQNGAEK